METPLLKRTPLYESHRQLNARMVSFGGWDMPVQYQGILEEHEACRRGCVVFDICHMGEFLFEGDATQSGLEKILTCSLTTIPVKSCRYGLMLNAQGGVIDDLIVFRLDQKKYMLVVNAANIDKDFQHLHAHLTDPDALKDISRATGKLDIQGPLSREALKPLVPDIEKLSYYRFDQFSVLGEKSIVSRTGYTGELGYEIFFPWDKARILWQKILENDLVKPAGLGARDILRIEMAYSLYGHEIDETTDPFEAGLEKFVDISKDFLGRSALLKNSEQPSRRRIIYFVAESRRSPRQGHQVWTRAGEAAGRVTSGTFSPCVGQGIGIGLATPALNADEKEIFFGDEKNKILAKIVSKPFYRNGSLKH